MNEPGRQIHRTPATAMISTDNTSQQMADSFPTNKIQIVWIPRGRVFWPAELTDASSRSGSICVYLGASRARIMMPDEDKALPFGENLERYWNQSFEPDFVDAVLEGIRISGEGQKIGRHLIRRRSEEESSFESESESKSDNAVDDNTIIALGTRIRIRAADAIHPKLQVYAKTEAVIIEPPRNPDSWYCVQLNDGNIVKIRRSAFQTLDIHKGGIPNIEVRSSAPSDRDRKRGLSQRPSLYRRNAPRESKLKRKMVSVEVSDSPKRRKHQGKSRGAKSNLVGKHVVIECGRYKGETGHVIRGGNGYYCVQLEGRNSAGGNVMKRSSDLRPIPFPASDSDANRKSTKLPYRLSKGQGQDTDASSPSSKTESWVNRKVYVRAGKHQGKTGIVRRSGHGFYCVSIKAVGDVMKRASDLKLYEDKGKKQSRDEFDVTLKSAASILMDMMAVADSEDHEAAVSDENCTQTISSVPVVKSKNASENLPEVELKTPILRATDQRDVLNWSYANRTQALSNNSKADAENKIHSVQLPQATGKHTIDTFNVQHSLSTYW